MRSQRIDDSGSELSNVLKALGLLEVGDAVYYRAPKPSYSVRKSTVVEVIKSRCHQLGVPRLVYVLANGERLDQWHAYATRSFAEVAIIKDLKSSITFKKVWMTNLQHEIAYEENVLERMERRTLAY